MLLGIVQLCRDGRYLSCLAELALQGFLQEVAAKIYFPAEVFSPFEGPVLATSYQCFLLDCWSAVLQFEALQADTLVKCNGQL